MDDDASVEQVLSEMIDDTKTDDSLKKSSSEQSLHNDQVVTTPSSKDAAVTTVRHSFEAMQLFAEMQYEIDRQLIDIERRKKELIQSYLEATNARLEQELLLGKEEESFLSSDDIVLNDKTSIQQMKRKIDGDIDDETSMEEQNVKKKRRRLSRRMAVLLSDDDEDDIAPSTPLPSNMMDTAGPPTITNHRRRTLEIDDAEILSLWKSSPVE
jgi:hypothetical protein